MTASTTGTWRRRPRSSTSIGGSGERSSPPTDSALQNRPEAFGGGAKSFFRIGLAVDRLKRGAHRRNAIVGVEIGQHRPQGCGVPLGIEALQKILDASDCLLRNHRLG